MSFMNEVLSSATFGESDRLDATIRELNKLQTRFDALLALMRARGLLTADELAELNRDTPASVSNEELDRLDVKVL